HTASTNFRQRAAQLELVARILRRERTSRNLPAAAPLAPGLADLTPAARNRLWACTSCNHGSWPTAWRHALRAIQREPASRASWRTLRYVWIRRGTTPWR